jgi:hypothetical protein
MSASAVIHGPDLCETRAQALRFAQSGFCTGAAKAAGRWVTALELSRPAGQQRQKPVWQRAASPVARPARSLQFFMSHKSGAGGAHFELSPRAAHLAKVLFFDVLRGPRVRYDMEHSCSI